MKDPSKYTKQELTVFSNSVAALAAAVIKQWKDDGCPEQDRPIIQAWQAVLDAAKEVKHAD